MRKQQKNILNKIGKSSFSDQEASLDLDLAPMLALMVTLIPIMLLSTVFVKVNVIETPLPQLVDKIVNDKSQKNVAELSLKMRSDKSFVFNVVSVASHQNKTFRISANEGSWDYQKLYEVAKSVKEDYPQVFILSLEPERGVSYKDMVKTMDEVRKLKNNERQFKVIEKESHKKISTQLMFPKIQLGNVLEG